MKNITMIICASVLTAMLLTGCGCRNSKPLDTMPSENTTAPTTMATTEATTMPTTMATSEATEPTVDHGNGPLPTEETDTTEGTGDTARSRTMPRVK